MRSSWLRSFRKRNSGICLELRDQHHSPLSAFLRPLLPFRACFLQECRDALRHSPATLSLRIGYSVRCPERHNLRDRTSLQPRSALKRTDGSTELLDRARDRKNSAARDRQKNLGKSANRFRSRRIRSSDDSYVLDAIEIIRHSCFRERNSGFGALSS